MKKINYKDFIGVDYKEVFKKKQDIGEETYKNSKCFLLSPIDKIMGSFNNFNNEINNIKLEKLNCDGEIRTPEIYEAKEQIGDYEEHITMTVDLIVEEIRLLIIR